MTSSNPFFHGSDALDVYFAESPPNTWSYTDFLLANRNAIVNSSPYTDDWRGLDGAWVKRFLKKVEQFASKEEYEQAKLGDNRRLFWEPIITERKQIIVKNLYEYESLNLLEISGNVSSKKLGHKLASELPTIIDSKQQVLNIMEEGISLKTLLKLSITCMLNTQCFKLKYFQEFIPLFEQYKEQQKSNICTNDDVMDIQGDSGFARFLTVNQYTKVLSDSTTKDRQKRTLTDWIHVTNSLVEVKDGDTEDVT
ncbi:5487_t:CDS:2, partial [Paraglomus brasilianum]